MAAYLDAIKLLAFLAPLMAKCSRRVVSVVYQTEQKCLVKSRVTKEPTPERFTAVYKFSCATVIIGAEYEELVNAQRAREGMETDFQAEAHAWAEHVEGSEYLLRHKKNHEKQYLQLFPTQVKSLYTDKDLQVLSPAEVKHWFEHWGPAPKDPNGGWQDLDRPIKVINPSLDNIIYVQSGANKFGNIKDKEFILSLIDQNQ